jgi:hypothetical protein
MFCEIWRTLFYVLEPVPQMNEFVTITVIWFSFGFLNSPFMHTESSNSVTSDLID